MSDKRVSAMLLEFDPCEVEACEAPEGMCYYNNGWMLCHHGPCRNWKDRVERRSGGDRRKESANG